MQTGEKIICLRSPDGKEAVDEKILRPFHHLVQVPGCRSRTTMGLALNHWLDIPESKLNLINRIVDILYDFGLMIDDLEDNTETRRGKPVANKIYGIQATHISANHAATIALQKLLLLENPKLIEICTRYLLLVFKGTGYDCYWRDELVCPTIEDFCRLSDATTSYFLMTLELLQVFSKNKADFSKLVKLLGKYYQIRNDYFSLWSEKYMRARKCYYEDLTDGKFSFPITYAVNNSPKSHEITNFMKQKTEDIKLKKYCMSLIEECGTKEYTRNFLDDLLRQIYEEIEKFGGNPMLEKYIADIIVTDES